MENGIVQLTAFDTRKEQTTSFFSKVVTGGREIKMLGKIFGTMYIQRV